MTRNVCSLTDAVGHTRIPEEIETFDDLRRHGPRFFVEDKPADAADIAVERSAFDQVDDLAVDVALQSWTTMTYSCARSIAKHANNTRDFNSENSQYFTGIVHIYLFFTIKFKK